MSTKVQLCISYLEKAGNEGEKYCQMLMHSKAKEEEPFVKLEWAPSFLRQNYAPEHLDGDAAAASPIVFAFRNRELRYGLQGPWCIGTATWLLVERGPVIVLGMDLDHALQDAEKPIGNAKDLVDRMLSQAGKDAADLVNRVRFQVYAATGSVLWVPQGVALALIGPGAGGNSAVVFFPWLSSKVAAEHKESNDVCGKTIATVSVNTLQSKEKENNEKVYLDARAAVPYFSRLLS